MISMHGARDTTIARVPVCFQPSGNFLFVSFVSRMISGRSRQRRERRALPLKKKKTEREKKREDLVHGELKRDPYEGTGVEVDGRFQES